MSNVITIDVLDHQFVSPIDETSKCLKCGVSYNFFRLERVKCPT